MKQNSLNNIAAFRVSCHDLPPDSLHILNTSALFSEDNSAARLFLFDASRENLLRFYLGWANIMRSFGQMNDFFRKLSLYDVPSLQLDLTSLIEEPATTRLNLSPSSLEQLRSILVDNLLLGLAINSLDHKEIERALRFKVKEFALRYLCAHIFIRLILSSEWIVSPEKLSFVYNRFGKPFLTFPKLPEGFSFNFSDSGEHCALFYSFKGAVGVDIEFCSTERPDTNNIEFLLSTRPKEIIESGLFFSLGERGQIERGGDQQFYRYWTRKESFLKWLGVGLVDNLSEIDVSVGVKCIVPKISSNEKVEDGFQFELIDRDRLIDCFVFTFETSELVVSLAMTKPEFVRIFNLKE